MLAICYLLIAFWAGSRICSLFLPEHREGDTADLWVRGAASFGVGTLILSWASYFLAWGIYKFFHLKNSLGVADMVVSEVCLLFLLISLLRRKKPFSFLEKPSWKEILFFGGLFLFFLACFFYVFFVSGDTLFSGLTVFSDYSPHTAMMRSFSKQNNYPTQYTHFGGEDVRYHFLFQFLVGNLEYLGLRLDIAYNLPSALSLTGFFIVLYGILKRMGHGLVALFFTLVTFLFRSGTAFFQYAWEHYRAGDLLHALTENRSFIGYTQNETWGFWNFNVYLNQRHLAFGLLIVAVAIYCFLDHVESGMKRRSKEMKWPEGGCVPPGRRSFLSFRGAAAVEEEEPAAVEEEEPAVVEEEEPAAMEEEEPAAIERLDGMDELIEAAAKKEGEPLPEKPFATLMEGQEVRERSAKLREQEEKAQLPQEAFDQGQELSFGKNASMSGLVTIRESLFMKEAWIVRHWLNKRAWQGWDLAGFFFLGLIVGLTSFWNGASVIGGLLILAGMAVFSDGKLDYLVMAFAAVMTSILQTKIFIWGEAVSPSIYVGFLAEDKSLPGMLIYLFMITGVGLLGLLLILPAVKKLERVMIFALALPVLFAFTASLTPDIGVNHKYILISYAFGCILWGGVFEKLLKKGVGSWLLALVLLVCLTLTGAYDFATIIRGNGRGRSYGQPLNGETTQWLYNHLDSSDLVMSPRYSMSETTLAGVMLYNGWPYYAWSAGYDTYDRGEKQQRFYSSYDPQELLQICRDEGITYIIYEDGMNLDEVECHEETIMSTFPKVYEAAYLRIYQVTDELLYEEADDFEEADDSGEAQILEGGQETVFVSEGFAEAETGSGEVELESAIDLMDGGLWSLVESM